MIDINEYEPKGGWIKFNRRKEAEPERNIFFLSLCISTLFFAYLFVGTLEAM